MIRRREIIFARLEIPGAAARSYGIQVARLAGVPRSVIVRAEPILAKLQNDDTAVTLNVAPTAKRKKKITVEPADDSPFGLL